ncbi:MAG: hypothetical protein ACFFAE_05850 [Candidatus Hodarchaeota archaeon]
MNLLELMKPGFELTYTFVLGALVFLTFRAAYSHWADQNDQKGGYRRFLKAKKEYIDPPRPRSKSYFDFLQLAKMTSRTRQERLTHVVSQLIKEHSKLSNQTEKLEYSENLISLITDPYKWFLKQEEKINKSDVAILEDKTSEHLYEQFTQILTEYQQLTGISLFPKED